MAGIVAGAVVLVAACGFAVAGVVQVADAADDDGRDRVRVSDSCAALEVRLNRLAPPGAAANPRERARAIRDENAALVPFLDDLGRAGDERLARRWTQLVTARTAYADALDRQVASGAPAFFVAPVDERGDAVAQRLSGRHDQCAAAVRRLAAPDL
ncbi:hypothetical protein [Asanoa siamensis]|uniref:hypothetical protein n=1 Tax=Asanoa siamensis TaxID=926357 RepID=UPI0019438C5A|nr:hypothetical protein [Asanoa siamensis]